MSTVSVSASDVGLHVGLQPGDRLMKARDAATWLGYNVKTVQRMAARGELPGHRSPRGKWYFAERELLEWVEKGGEL